MRIVIEPKNKWWQIDFKEIWEFRDLFYFLAWRDLKVKYKQTFVGIGWAIFQPFITMIVFTIFFGKLAQIPSDGVPYPIFVYAGLLFWGLFSNSLSNISTVFVDNEKIVTKIYFPRIMLPISVVFTCLVDFLMAFLVFVGMMFYYQYVPSIEVLWLFPFLILMTIFTSLGVGFFLASFNVKYRDVRYILPFFIQLLLFLTPVIYPVSIVSEKFQWILGLNPMTGVIDTARVILLGIGEINWFLLLISGGFLILYFLLGILYFKQTERYFADVI